MAVKAQPTSENLCFVSIGDPSGWGLLLDLCTAMRLLKSLGFQSIGVPSERGLSRRSMMNNKQRAEGFQSIDGPSEWGLEAMMVESSALRKYLVSYQ